MGTVVATVCVWTIAAVCALLHGEASTVSCRLVPTHAGTTASAMTTALVTATGVSTPEVGCISFPCPTCLCECSALWCCCSQRECHATTGLVLPPLSSTTQQRLANCRHAVVSGVAAQATAHAQCRTSVCATMAGMATPASCLPARIPAASMEYATPTRRVPAIASCCRRRWRSTGALGIVSLPSQPPRAQLLLSAVLLRSRIPWMRWPLQATMRRATPALIRRRAVAPPPQPLYETPLAW